MKHFVKVSMILGTIIIVMGIIKFQENNLKNKTKENKDVQEKRQQEILDICRTNKVMKIYSQNDGENFYVVLENQNIYKLMKISWEIMQLENTVNKLIIFLTCGKIKN